MFLALSHLVWGSATYHLYMRKWVSEWVMAHPHQYKKTKKMGVEGTPASEVEL